MKDYILYGQCYFENKYNNNSNNLSIFLNAHCPQYLDTNDTINKYTITE